ncbi:MAG: 3-hydroxyacyl-CoA dehydrogenase family protein [Chloroflexi bacterium]|jgi:3-hydroxyacyl-CoA dehydrogenase|nr:3-hydroxyacyl-CoA dehydrogenase family protein [Chloroflexota bacterium]
MENVLVVGAGFMGSGIGQVCAQAGCKVHLMDVKAAALDKAMSEIKWSLNKLGSKGLLKDPPQKIMERIIPEHDLSSAAKVSWVIEAALEIEALKKQIFKELDRLASPKTPLASNTSTIPITRIAQATQHPDRVLGLHFFGPVPLMGLVEVIKGEKTSTAVFERGVAFVKSLGKTPVQVQRDIPGFVMNRIFSAAFREAADLVAEGITTPEDVDIGMRLGYGWNAGPFEIADNAGLDIYVLVGQTMKALGEENLVPRSDLIERMVKEGRLGRKVGKGFYRYTPEGKRLPWENKGQK